jgi:hypothetical protein
MQVVSREGNVQSTPRIAPILRAATVTGVRYASLAEQLNRNTVIADQAVARAQVWKAAPDRPAGLEHLYRHFNEWSRAHKH